LSFSKKIQKNFLEIEKNKKVQEKFLESEKNKKVREKFLKSEKNSRDNGEQQKIFFKKK